MQPTIIQRIVKHSTPRPPKHAPRAHRPIRSRRVDQRQPTPPNCTPRNAISPSHSAPSKCAVGLYRRPLEKPLFRSRGVQTNKVANAITAINGAFQIRNIASLLLGNSGDPAPSTCELATANPCKKRRPVAGAITVRRFLQTYDFCETFQAQIACVGTGWSYCEESGPRRCGPWQANA